MVQRIEGRMEALTALTVLIGRPPHRQLRPRHVDDDESDYDIEEDENNLFAMNRPPRRNLWQGNLLGDRSRGSNLTY